MPTHEGLEGEGIPGHMRAEEIGVAAGVGGHTKSLTAGGTTPAPP